MSIDSSTSLELPPTATISWSSGDAQAVAITCWSRVPSPYGSSCLGWPSRLEPPAASTRPVTNRLPEGCGISGWIALEGLAAAFAAEVDAASFVFGADARRRHRDGHPAHGVGRAGGRGGGHMLGASRDDLGEDRK